MEVYVYDRRSFEYVTRAVATSWDLPLGSYQAASGSVVVAASFSADYKGHWLLAGGEVWVIDRVEPADGMTTITILPGIDAFNRPIMLSSEPATNGELIYQALLDNFKSPADPSYALPYLEITVTDETSLERPEISEAGLWTLPDYVRSVADRTNVRLAVAGNVLRISVAPTQLSTHVVAMEGSVELLQQTYSRQFTAKVTVVQSTGSKDYYVDADGMIGETPPSPRIDGEWSVVEARDNKDPEEAAAEIFAGNVSANKIAFMALPRYHLGDTVRTRLNDKAAAVQVTAIRARSTDKRYYYECGSLTTSLTPAILSSSCASSSLAFPMMYSEYKFNRQGDTIQPCVLLSQFVTSLLFNVQF